MATQANTVEIAQLDVSRTDDPKTVALWLIIDVPAKFDAERLAPAEMISERLDGDELKQVITSVVGTNTLLNFRMQIRYGETLDLKTGKVITR